MSHYPENTRPPRRGYATFCCTNPECRQTGWNVAGVYDLGTFSADEYEDTFCPSCGQEGE